MQDITPISQTASRDKRDKTAPLKLLFINFSGIPKNRTERVRPRPRREIYRHAQRNAFLTRKHTRQEALLQSRKLPPSRLVGDHVHQEVARPDQLSEHGTSASTAHAHQDDKHSKLNSTDDTVLQNSRGAKSDHDSQRWFQNNRPRQLPFTLLPVSNNGQISEAFEYFKHMYTPISQRLLSRSSSTGFRICCQAVLQDAMLFEQMMAYVLVSQNMHKTPKLRRTPGVLYHCNRAIAQLRQRFHSPNVEDCVNDTVIMTILLLIAIHHTCADYEPLKFHMKALRHITDLRGGSHNLGWDGFLEMSLRTVEDSWKSVITKQQLPHRYEPYSLTYPSYPYQPTLCQSISRFPRSLRELALQRILSLQFMHILERMLLAMSDTQDISKSMSVAYGAIDDLVTSPQVSTLERILAIALLSCALVPARARGIVPPTVEMGIQAQARLFPAARDPAFSSHLGEQALDWAALALYSALEKGSIAWTWAEKRITRAPVGLFLDSYRHNLQQNFLAIPSLADYAHKVA